MACKHLVYVLIYIYIYYLFSRNICLSFIPFYFCVISVFIYSGLNQAATNFYSFDQGRIAAFRLFEMISRSSSTVNHEGTTLVTVQGNIEFRNVYFSYLSRPEIPILSGFYLTVPAKKAVALVGRNGSGKSSIIPLMERFYDPTLGMRVIFLAHCGVFTISFKVPLKRLAKISACRFQWFFHFVVQEKFFWTEKT